jgi:hypothetical protein
MSMNREEKVTLFCCVIAAAAALSIASFYSGAPVEPEPRGPTIKGDSAAPPVSQPDRPADLDAKLIKAIEGLRATNDAQNIAIAFLGQAIAPSGAFSTNDTTVTMQIQPVKIDPKGNVQGGFKLGGRK